MKNIQAWLKEQPPLFLFVPPFFLWCAPLLWVGSLSDYSNVGNLGAYFGCFASLVTTVLVFLAFRKQDEELQSARQIAESSEKSQRLSRFENTFFILLNLIIEQNAQNVQSEKITYFQSINESTTDKEKENKFDNIVNQIYTDRSLFDSIRFVDHAVKLIIRNNLASDELYLDLVSRNMREDVKNIYLLVSLDFTRPENVFHAGNESPKLSAINGKETFKTLHKYSFFRNLDIKRLPINYTNFIV